MDLSIVIPALDESQKIGQDIETAAKFLKSNDLTGEIIVVDDGSRDGTAQIAKDTKAGIPAEVSLKVLQNEQNRGKGYAVKTGIKETTGKYVMFADCGCCVPYEYILPGLKILQNSESNIDIAHGSRKLDESIIIQHQNLYRRICSVLFRWFMISVIKVPSVLSDTQCGFKIYHGDIARKLYNQCIADGFMFDIEITMRAQKEGLRIKEFPVKWTCDRDSRLSPARNLRRILLELISIKRALAKEYHNG